MLDEKSADHHSQWYSFNISQQPVQQVELYLWVEAGRCLPACEMTVHQLTELELHPVTSAFSNEIFPAKQLSGRWLTALVPRSDPHNSLWDISVWTEVTERQIGRHHRPWPVCQRRQKADEQTRAKIKRKSGSAHTQNPSHPHMLPVSCTDLLSNTDDFPS